MCKIICIHPKTKRKYHIHSLKPNKGCISLTVCDLCGSLIRKEYNEFDLSWIHNLP